MTHKHSRKRYNARKKTWKVRHGQVGRKWVQGPQICATLSGDELRNMLLGLEHAHEFKAALSSEKARSKPRSKTIAFIEARLKEALVKEEQMALDLMKRRFPQLLMPTATAATARALLDGMKDGDLLERLKHACDVLELVDEVEAVVYERFGKKAAPKKPAAKKAAPKKPTAKKPAPKKAAPKKTKEV